MAGEVDRRRRCAGGAGVLEAGVAGLDDTAVGHVDSPGGRFGCAVVPRAHAQRGALELEPHPPCACPDGHGERAERGVGRPDLADQRAGRRVGVDLDPVVRRARIPSGRGQHPHRAGGGELVAEQQVFVGEVRGLGDDGGLAVGLIGHGEAEFAAGDGGGAAVGLGDGPVLVVRDRTVGADIEAVGEDVERGDRREPAGGVVGVAVAGAVRIGPRRLAARGVVGPGEAMMVGPHHRLERRIRTVRVGRRAGGVCRGDPVAVSVVGERRCAAACVGDRGQLPREVVGVCGDAAGRVGDGGLPAGRVVGVAGGAQEGVFGRGDLVRRVVDPLVDPARGVGARRAVVAAVVAEAGGVADCVNDRREGAGRVVGIGDRARPRGVLGGSSPRNVHVLVDVTPAGSVTDTTRPTGSYPVVVVSPPGVVTVVWRPSTSYP